MGVQLTNLDNCCFENPFMGMYIIHYFQCYNNVRLEIWKNILLNYLGNKWVITANSKNMSKKYPIILQKINTWKNKYWENVVLQ